MSLPEWAKGGVLICGARGMLGRELVALCRGRMDEASARSVHAWDLDELDLVDEDDVGRKLQALRPGVVLNAAAFTDVDGCETNVERALAVNGTAPGHLARACAAVGATLVHFGTDFIFDGSAGRAYRPDDKPNPLSVYGRSKREGEQAVRSSGCRHLIVRTSWLFGPGGRNFVEAILARAEAGEALRVVTDQVGSPTYARDLAEALVALLEADARGTVHFANAGQCSWFEFAREILRQTEHEVHVEPITSQELSRPAHRPAYSVLDTSGYAQITGRRPPAWEDALRRCLQARCVGAR